MPLAPVRFGATMGGAGGRGFESVPTRTKGGGPFGPAGFPP